MTFLRMLLSVALFIAAVLALVGLFLNGFSWLYIAIAVGGFLLAAWVWPSDPKRYQYENKLNAWEWLEILELVIVLPAQIILWLFRFILSIGQLFDGV
jgi:hypothetical protein